MTSWIGRAVSLAFLLWASTARTDETVGSRTRAAPPAEVPCGEDEALLRAFQEVRTLRAAFVDQREVDLLAEPLTSRGRLLYQRPDRLYYAIESPGHQEVVVVGSRVRVTQRSLGRSQDLDLQTSEVARAIVTSLLEVLGGRREQLETRYRCHSRRVPEGFEVRLEPRGAPLDRVLRGIEVRIGADGGLREVRIREATGDTSRMVLQDLRLNVPLTPEEEKAHFSP